MIFQQEGSLCAQHCLNSLLQGPYFTPVDLSTLAQRMDDEERQRMAECGEESEEYRKFLEQPSGNMDDSGYFSVQVISSALQVWGLELVPYSSTDDRVKSALTNPCNMKAFICNYKDHWFTIRQLGNQWFNLNSLLNKPELISDTYLALFLAQLKNDGYSIFVVLGDLPECEADQLLKIRPAQPTTRRSPPQRNISEDDEDLQTALQLSLAEDNYVYNRTESTEDRELQEAVRLSLEPESKEEVDDDDVLLEKAIHMSLEC